MIELPAGVVPNSAEPALVDRGGVMRGASALRVNRKGAHYRITCTLPPLLPDVGRVVVSRLIRAKREGLRIAFPLMHDQGLPGVPAVAGANQQGRALVIKFVPPGYVFREGFWISIRQTDGQHYLHNITADVTAGETGVVSIAIEPELRAPFPDGAWLNVAAPMIEGLVDGDEMAWEYSLAHHTGIGFTIEEAR